MGLTAALAKIQKLKVKNESGLFSLLILPNTYKLHISSVNFIDPCIYLGQLF